MTFIVPVVFVFPKTTSYNYLKQWLPRIVLEHYVMALMIYLSYCLLPDVTDKRQKYFHARAARHHDNDMTLSQAVVAHDDVRRVYFSVFCNSL